MRIAHVAVSLSFLAGSVPAFADFKLSDLEFGVALIPVQHYGKIFPSTFTVLKRDAGDLTLPEAVYLASPQDRAEDQPGPFQGGASFSLSYEITPRYTVQLAYDGVLGVSPQAFASGTAVRLTNRFPGTHVGDLTSYKSEVDVSVSALSLSVLRLWPIADGIHGGLDWSHIELLGRAGAAFIHTDVESTIGIGVTDCVIYCGTGVEHSSDTVAPVLGIGIAYTLFRQGKVSLEYRRTLDFGNTQAGRYWVESVSLGFDVTFALAAAASR